jgi:hypothetical protein
MYICIYIYVYIYIVLDATPSHYSVELLAKMRKIMIEKDKIILVGDKNGSVDPVKQRLYPVRYYSLVIYFLLLLIFFLYLCFSGWSIWKHMVQIFEHPCV